MSKSKKTTCVASATVNYSFICEQCGQDSGSLTHTFTGNSYASTPKLEYLHMYQVKAEEDLNKQIRKVRFGKKYPYNDECPHCGAHQTWGIPQHISSIAADAFLIVGSIFLSYELISSIIEGPKYFWLTLLPACACIIASVVYVPLCIKDIFSEYHILKNINPFKHRDAKEKRVPVALWETLSQPTFKDMWSNEHL